MWFAGGKCGVTWQLVQIQVRPPTRLVGSGNCHIMDDSDDDDIVAELDEKDVEEVDAVVFQGMSKTTTFLAQRLTRPPASTAQSVALIVNALAKVGVTDKEVFSSVSQLLKRAGKGEDRLRYDAQAVSNIVDGPTALLTLR